MAAVFVAFTFDTAVVRMLQWNLLGLFLDAGDAWDDPFIRAVIVLFIGLNNILFAMLFFKKEPVLFRDELFHVETARGGSEPSRKPHLFFGILLLAVLDVFLFYTFQELGRFSLTYRLFVTGWSLFMVGLMLYFLKRALDFNSEEARLLLDRQYQQDMLSFFGLVRSQRHDFNFHLTSVYGLIKEGQYEEASAYISEVVKKVQQVNELLPLRHPAVSALLNTLGEQAKQQGIRIRYVIHDDLRDMACSVYDINKVLGNLIQNAIEEIAENVPESAEREIEVEIMKEHQQTVIRVTNPARLDDERAGRMFESGFTSKAGHEGVGLAGTERLVQRYHGVIFPELADGRLTLNVRIPETG
ncbi:sensor histidine kinase [Bhargavaea ullalensis]|uniref:Anti-sigma regulatory factor (Ser/Thr protein kinase) n=1 Tax=Bhargavaea ullalensis TaxID=1265685 RepID=A0ABV2G7A6_9BACL